MNSRRPRTLAWSLAIGWLVVIYATTPLVGSLVAWTYRWFDPAWYPLAVGAVLAFVGFFCARRLFGLAQGVAAAGWPVRIALLFLFCGVYLVFRAIEEPVGKIHLLEYGILAVLVWRAVRLDVPDRSALATSALLCLTGGLGDEFIQGVLPDRVGELLDVRVNLFATLLALAGVVLLAPTGRGARMGRMSLRWLAGSLLAVIALFFSFMTWNPDVHYGYRFRVAPNLTFYSMLSWDELERADRAWDARTVALLDEQHDAQARLHLAVMDRWRADGRLSAATDALFRHIFLHHEYLRSLLLGGRPADAFREYSVHKIVYLNLLWAHPPRWTPDVEARVRGLISDAAQAPPFRSHYLPESTPVYEFSVQGRRYVAFCPLPATEAREILRTERKTYESILSETRNEAAYEQFLVEHPVEREPSLYELRTHLFRRDRYALLADYSVAFWENEIVERCFGGTVRRTSWQWSQETCDRVGRLVPGVELMPYESAVGDGYIYWASRRALQVGCGVAAVAVIGFYWMLRRRINNPKSGV